MFGYSEYTVWRAVTFARTSYRTPGKPSACSRYICLPAYIGLAWSRDTDHVQGSPYYLALCVLYTLLYGVYSI